MSLQKSVMVGSMGGSVVGQAVAWNQAHQENKRSRKGFIPRMANHLGMNVVGGFAGSAAGMGIGAAGHFATKMIRRGR